MITLQTLPAARAKSRPKRVGRGNASGKGTTAGRGTKGQRARTGGRKQLVRRGLKPLVARTPKVRGFQSRRAKFWTVSTSALERVFSEGDEITPGRLLQAKLIPSLRPGVKVLGGGKLQKKLTVRAQRFSQAAAQAIEKAGGKAVRSAPPPPDRPSS